MINNRTALSGALALFSLAIAGCGGGGDGEPQSNTGQLTLGLTDGPIESALRVVVAFTGIELKPAGDEPALDPILFDANSCNDFDAALGTCLIDLLELVSRCPSPDGYVRDRQFVADKLAVLQPFVEHAIEA